MRLLILHVLSLCAVGYPYGGFMYTFVGKVSPFLIISALTLLNLGERLSTEDGLLHCLPVPQGAHVLWPPYISVVLGSPGNVDWIHYRSEEDLPFRLQTLDFKHFD